MRLMPVAAIAGLGFAAVLVATCSERGSCMGSPSTQVGCPDTDPVAAVIVGTASVFDTEGPSRAEQEAYLAGNYCMTWWAWTGASLAGVALGNLIPTSWGLGFAGVLCLVGILCSLANSPLRVLAMLVAGAAAVAAYTLPLKLNIVVAIAIAVIACFWLEGRLPAAAREATR